MEKVNGVIIGAGVVGLAVARALILASPVHAKDWFILEADDAIGKGISSRSSEVIHSGIYYPPGSLKAKLCVQGRDLLYRYLNEHDILNKKCGKLIVATSNNHKNKLDLLMTNAIENGVHDLIMLNGTQAMQIEPELICEAALYCPSTGIIDSNALMLNYQNDFEKQGGGIVLNSEVEGAHNSKDGIILNLSDGSKILADKVVNAAGLYAPSLARKFDGLDVKYIPKSFYAKGNYFTLTGNAPFSHLIYPVPENAGLGIHLTLDLNGQAKFGPDVQWVDNPSDFSVSVDREPQFYKEVRKYWPRLKDGALIPGYSGIRPKISGPEEISADFCIQGPRVHGIKGLVNLFGIESPGLTSSLAIADAVVDELMR